MRVLPSLLSISFGLAVLSGCATTRFEVSGPTPRQPLCQSPGEEASALVLWGPKWRPDQKDVPKREAVAGYGIERFFASSGCFARTKVIRRIGERESIDLSPAEVRALVAADATAPGYVLFITVRELGPIMKLLSSFALVEGGTDVVLEIRAVSPSTGQTTAALTVHWQNGGPLVLKGVATLEEDMGSALQEALQPSGSRK